MLCVISETILNNDQFLSPYIAESYPHQRKNHLTITYYQISTINYAILQVILYSFPFLFPTIQE